MPELTNPPLISVLIATYNRAQSLCRAIESVLMQPGDDFEVVIGDDASPDNTAEAVKPYLSDPRVRYYRNPANLGMRDNYLKIFHEARGDYIFILTDDDWMLEGALARVAAIVKTHPDVGYILSDLPTVDDRTGQVVSVYRAYATDRMVEPSVRGMADVAGHAWVLSRQVLKRELVDYPTWEMYKQNIFFPIIFSGRVLLKAPYYYIADQLVMHTWFNEVFWHRFGRDQLEIDFNLAADRHRAMREILHDYPKTAEVRAVIDKWDDETLKLYLDAEQAGFYDLVRGIGLRPALVKLRSGFRLTPRGDLALGLFFVLLPLRRGRVAAKNLLRKYAPGLFARLRQFKRQTSGQID